MKDIIDAKTKKNEFGIEGYDIPKFNPFMDKARVSKITNTKRKCYLDDYIKEKSHVPEAKYEVTQSLINAKKRSFLCKSPRVTLPG
jgi:hypothetical protein